MPDLVTPPRLLLRWGGAIVLLRLIARLIVSVGFVCRRDEVE